ncbi:MAG: hypothetical protein Q7T55_06460 [Solirubrobacteraceae bacterium]|nr:hypothetical protein [Solirubrobacteraceae bacterium]
MSDAKEPARTDSADAVLDAVTAEFREQVTRYAEREIARSGRPGPVSAADILHAADATAGLFRSSQDSADRRQLKLQFLSSAYRSLGALAAGLGVVAYALDQRTERDWPLLLVAIGAMAFAGSTFLTLLSQTFRLRQARSLAVPAFADSSSNLVEQNGLFLASWGQLESAIRDVVGLLAGESHVMASPRQLRGILIDFGVFSQNDAEVFTDLLRQRNSVAHGTADLDREALRQAFEQIQKLRSKLQDPEEILRRARNVPRVDARPGID